MTSLAGMKKSAGKEKSMKILCLDLETTIASEAHGAHAKDPKNYFVTTQWGVHPDNVHLQHQLDNIQRDLPEQFLKELKDTDILIGHNINFDLSYIYNSKDFQAYLARGGKIWCTQSAEYVLSAQRHSFSSLAELQEKYLGGKTKESRISRLFKAGIGADKIVEAKRRCPKVFALYEKYALDDVRTTLLIFSKQWRLAKGMKLIEAVQLEQEYLKYILIMSCTGIYVDIEGCQKTYRELKIKALELQTDAEAISAKYWTNPNLPTFNIASNAHKSLLLFGGCIQTKLKREDGCFKNGKTKFKTVDHYVGIRGFMLPVSLTQASKKEGFYKTGAEIIEQIYKSDSCTDDVKTFCGLMIEAANLNKMCKTYLEAFMRLSIDGKLYPNFNNTKTVTGRLSSSSPNMQNIPSNGEMCKNIKESLLLLKVTNA